MKHNIQFSMGFDLQAFRQSMEKVQKLVENMIAGLKKAFLALAGVVGIALSFKTIASGIGEAVRKGKELDMLARETGRTAEEIELFAEATHRAELSMSDAADVMSTWAGHLREAALGSTDLTGKLTYLGVSASSLSRLSLPEQFEKVAQKINSISDPVIRAQLAMDLFGAAGKKAVANFQSGDLAEAAKLFGKNALSLAKASRQMALIDDAWRRIKRAAEVVFTAIATRVAPVLQFVADKFLLILPFLNKWGSKIGQVILDAAAVLIGIFKDKTFSDGLKSIGEILSLSFKIAAREFADLLVQAVVFSCKLLEQGFGVAVGLLTDENLWTGLSEFFKSLADVLLTGIAKVMPAVARMFAMVASSFAQLVHTGLNRVKMFTEKKLLANEERDLEVIRKQNEKRGYTTGFNQLREWNIQDNINRLTESIAQTKREIDDAANFSATEFGNIAFEWTKKKSDEILKKHNTATAGQHWEEAKKSFAKVDYSKLEKLFKDIPELWRKSAQQIFADPALVRQLEAVIEQARRQGMTLLASLKKPEERPGEAGRGRAIKLGFGFGGVFDEMRRVGGGLGAAATNIQQRMYDKLAEIAMKNAEQVGLLQNLVERNAGSGDSSGLEVRGVI
jgi:hypothetical protein